MSRHTGAGSAFYTFDPQGGVAQRLDGGGSVLSSDLYDAFGGRQSTGGADVFGFGGQWGAYTDAETGMVLCTHRYYDPNAGRFLTRDPASYIGGVNLYAYCQNDPVNQTDPSGFGFNDGSVTNNTGGLQFGLGGWDPGRYHGRPTKPGEFPSTDAQPPYVAEPIPGKGSGPSYPVWPVGGPGKINDPGQNYVFPVAPGTTVGGGGVDIDAGWDPCNKEWIKTPGAPHAGPVEISNPGTWSPGGSVSTGGFAVAVPPGFYPGFGPGAGSNFGSSWPNPTTIVRPPTGRQR